jgi:hypothetical protein
MRRTFFDITSALAIQSVGETAHRPTQNEIGDGSFMSISCCSDVSHILFRHLEPRWNLSRWHHKPPFWLNILSNLFAKILASVNYKIKLMQLKNCLKPDFGV